jgi:hypothetical protein
MGQTRSEQETIIRWGEADQVVTVYSASPKTWRRCARLGLEVVKTAHLEGRESGRFYRVPLAGFRWGLKGKRRAAGNADTLAAAREARKARLNSPPLRQNNASEASVADPAR